MNTRGQCSDGWILQCRRFTLTLEEKYVVVVVVVVGEISTITKGEGSYSVQSGWKFTNRFHRLTWVLFFLRVASDRSGSNLAKQRPSRAHWNQTQTRLPVFTFLHLCWSLAGCESAGPNLFWFWRQKSRRGTTAPTGFQYLNTRALFLLWQCGTLDKRAAVSTICGDKDLICNVSGRCTSRLRLWNGCNLQLLSSAKRTQSAGYIDVGEEPGELWLDCWSVWRSFKGLHICAVYLFGHLWENCKNTR